MSKNRGLWANIHAKRERIKKGSGERMRKPGSKGAPSAADFRASQESVEIEEAMNPAMHRVKLIKRILKPIHAKQAMIREPQSTDSSSPSSRFDGANSVVRIYKKDTPGQ